MHQKCIHSGTRIQLHLHMHFLSGEKIKLGSVKRRRGWNQIWGLLAVILCLIASLNRMSTGTCPDRSRQLVKTHEFSTAQKVMFPSSLCSLKVVVLYVCSFSLREHAEREGGREHVCVCVCVCVITVPPIYVAFGEKTRFWCQWSCLSLCLIGSL